MRQGDVVWLRFGGSGSEPAGRRPALVVQDDRFNRSAGLPRACVVNVTQLGTVDRARIGKPLGTLGHARMDQVREGLALVQGCDRWVQP
jgi:mRNA interferase MazF